MVNPRKPCTLLFFSSPYELRSLVTFVTISRPSVRFLFFSPNSNILFVHAGRRRWSLFIPISQKYLRRPCEDLNSTCLLFHLYELLAVLRFEVDQDGQLPICRLCGPSCLAPTQHQPRRLLTCLGSW